MPDRVHLRSLAILMVAPQPFFRARGTPFSVLHRVRALVSAGHRVTLVTYPFGEDVDLPNLRIVRCPKPPLVSDVRIGPSAAKLPLDLLLYRETVRQLKHDKFDVLHSHEEAAFFVSRLAKRFGLPHIYDMHSSLPQQVENFGRFNAPPIRAVFKWLEQYVLDTCDGVITICPDLGELIEERCPDMPHSMIENTADDAQVFTAKQEAIRDTYGLRGKKIILYTGTFETYQGLPLLLSAFERVAKAAPEAHLVMVGGNRKQVERARDRLVAAELSDRATLAGTVHPSRIPSFLQAADMIVSPRSSGTNTPLKIYGYLRSGVPLIATDIFSHTQSLDSDVAHLVPPTVDGLERGLLRLLNDPAYAGQLGRNGARRAAEQYSDDQYLRKVIDFYQVMFPKSCGLPEFSLARQAL